MGGLEYRREPGEQADKEKYKFNEIEDSAPEISLLIKGIKR